MATEVAVGAVLGTVAAAVVLVTGGAVYGLEMPADPLGVLGSYLVGLACFTSIGVALGSLVPSGRSANALGDLVFVPLFLLGGGGPPRAVMTSAMQTLSASSPSATSGAAPAGVAGHDRRPPRPLVAAGRGHPRRGAAVLTARRRAG